MAKGLVQGGGGSIGSDDLTARAGDVLAGATYMGSDTDDDIGTGTLAINGNAATDDVVAGKTFYNTDVKGKRTGTLALNGTAAAGDVLVGKTFYDNDPKTARQGTLSFTGTAEPADVAAGKTFYNTDGKTQRTGTLALSGTATPADVLVGKTFYNDNPKTARQGTLALTGDAKESEVLAGRYFYADNPKTIKAGNMTNNGTVSRTLMAGEYYYIPAGYHSGSGKITAQSLAYQTEGSAGAEDVLLNKVAWVNGSKVVGSMANNGTVNQELNAGGYFTIPAGYHNGNGRVSAKTLASQTAGTAAASEILAGKTAWVGGSKLAGTMTNRGAVSKELSAGGSYTVPAGYHNGTGTVTAKSLASQTSATAAAANILSGKTAWVNGTKITGSLTVTPATNFNVAQYTDKTPQCTWARPASGSNWSGIHIRYSTTGYPASVSDGTKFYKGADTTAKKNIGTNGKIYFSAWSYLTTSNGEVLSSVTHKTITLVAIQGKKTFSAGATWKVPDDVYSVDAFVVGGGGGSAASYKDGGYIDLSRSGGGGGGYTAKKTFSVTPGESLTVTVGAGGKGKNYDKNGAGYGGNGGASSVKRGSTTLVSASGGKGGYTDGATGKGAGGNGGSGGGGIRGDADTTTGGTNGGNGSATSYGTGQGTSTKDWDGTVYSGGGGGCPISVSGAITYGGAGGGGRGGGYSNTAGADGLGGGAGGGGGYADTGMIARDGGSGIVIIRWGY